MYRGFSTIMHCLNLLICLMTDLLFIVLLQVVGPSGTGKTDVAVQIIPTLTGCMDHTHTNWLFVLVQVVGPPGTGKTDVTVQIIPTLTGCLYRSYPHWLVVSVNYTHAEWLFVWIIPTLTGCLYWCRWWDRRAQARLTLPFRSSRTSTTTFPSRERSSSLTPTR